MNLITFGYCQNPDAEGFYLKKGALKVGKVYSSNLQEARDYCHVSGNIKQEIIVKLEEYLKTLSD